MATSPFLVSPDYVNLLNSIADQTRNLLVDWFAQDHFLPQAASIFGATVDSSDWVDKALALKQSILNGEYAIRLEIRTNNELQEALGAYSCVGTTALSNSGTTNIRLTNNASVTFEVGELNNLSINNSGATVNLLPSAASFTNLPRRVCL